MKTFKDLQVGDYIYCIDKDRKVSEILQIYSKTKGNVYDIFICSIILHDKLQGFTSFICLNTEKDCLETTRGNTYITTDENVFTKHLKSIIHEDV